MKNITSILFLAFGFVACNNETDNKTTNNDSSLMTSDSSINMGQISLPYTVEKTRDYEGEKLHKAAIAMNMLRAFETYDMNTLGKYFADTVAFYFTTMFKGSRDSLIIRLRRDREGFNNYTVKMRDYESYKERNDDDWVTLFYTEIFTDKNGKTDSAMITDQIRIVNGKVAEID